MELVCVVAAQHAAVPDPRRLGRRPLLPPRTRRAGRGRGREARRETLPLARAERRERVRDLEPRDAKRKTRRRPAARSARGATPSVGSSTPRRQRAPAAGSSPRRRGRAPPRRRRAAPSSVNISGASAKPRFVYESFARRRSRPASAIAPWSNAVVRQRVDRRATRCPPGGGVDAGRDEAEVGGRELAARVRRIAARLELLEVRELAHVDLLREVPPDRLLERLAALEPPAGQRPRAADGALRAAPEERLAARPSRTCSTTASTAWAVGGRLRHRFSTQSLKLPEESVKMTVVGLVARRGGARVARCGGGAAAVAATRSRRPRRRAPSAQGRARHRHRRS